jgi:hypothetical protein
MRQKMCKLCELFISANDDAFSIATDSRTGLPIPAGSLVPEDAKIFSFPSHSEAREWFHRNKWEKDNFGVRQELRLTNEERQLIEFYSDTRQKVDEKKGDLERLLHSGIIRNVAQGVEIHGYKISPSGEIYRIGSQETATAPFCGLGPIAAEGIERATDMIAMFELYLEHVHAEEMKQQRKLAEPKDFRAQPKEVNVVRDEQERALEVISRVMKSVEDQQTSRVALVKNPQLDRRAESDDDKKSMNYEQQPSPLLRKVKGGQH